MFRIEGNIHRGGVEHQLVVSAARGQRQRTLDGKPAGLEATLGIFSCLVFASPRLDIFRGGPEERRRFLDRGLVAVEPGLIPVYREHGRGLVQKNQLLRRARETGGANRWRDQVTAFNAHLAVSGNVIQRARSRYVDRLQMTLAGHKALGELVPGGPPKLEYLPSPALEVAAGGESVELEAGLRRALDERIEDEVRCGHALIGPQRDTLSIRQRGWEMSGYGSSGQQRAALIALKVAKMLVQRQVSGDYPMLLVDDIDSDLDGERTRRALELLGGPFQVLVASSRGQEWPVLGPETRLLTVEDGIITEA